MDYIEEVGIEAARKSLNDDIDDPQRCFKPAKNGHLYDGNRGPFEIRPLVAVAYRFQRRRDPTLRPLNFPDIDGKNILKHLQPIHSGFRYERFERSIKTPKEQPKWQWS